MIRVLRAEWRKLRRPTLLLGALGTAVFLSGLVTALLYLLIDSDAGNGDRGRVITRAALSAPDGVVVGFASVGGLLGIVALCVFAAQTAQEYTYGTLRNLLVRQPRRILLLVGKLGAMKLFAVLMVALSLVVSAGISFGLAGGAKVNSDLWLTNDGVWAIGKTFINVLISVIGFGIIGMVLGLLFRSPISSISVGVLWLLIVENLVGAIKASTLQWLPGSQLQTIASGGSETISYTHALGVGGAYVLTGLLIASFLFARRDVTN